MPGQLVLVTGAGRSGTSTMSGMLHHLGLHVPGPFIGANVSNPKGFFENAWSTEFHDAICERAGIHVFDSRPAAEELIAAALTPDDRADLGAFMERQTSDHPQTVVKDPRIVWASHLWASTATQQGLAVAYVSMLRHPAEVAGSRISYYSGYSDNAEESPEAANERKRYAAQQVARWINVTLLTERTTRGARRAFVRYVDLLEDWRRVASRLQADFDLRFEADITPGAAPEIDAFIDPGLRRHGVSWDDVGVDGPLRDLAEEVWQQINRLVEHPDPDGSVSARLDELTGDYAGLIAASEAGQGAIPLEDTAGAVADRTNIGHRADWRTRVRDLSGLMDQASELLGAGEERDAVLAGHFSRELDRLLTDELPACDAATAQELFDTVGEVATAHLSPTVGRMLTPIRRLRWHHVLVGRLDLLQEVLADPPEAQRLLLERAGVFVPRTGFRAGTADWVFETPTARVGSHVEGILREGKVELDDARIVVTGSVPDLDPASAGVMRLALTTLGELGNSRPARERGRRTKVLAASWIAIEPTGEARAELDFKELLDNDALRGQGTGRVSAGLRLQVVMDDRVLDFPISAVIDAESEFTARPGTVRLAVRSGYDDRVQLDLEIRPRLIGRIRGRFDRG